jgi:hypothetical protein
MTKDLKGNVYVRTKILINDHRIVQVNGFNYLGYIIALKSTVI